MSVKQINSIIISSIEKEFNLLKKELPDIFNWNIVFSDDSDEIKQKKKYISTVKNQYLCGCCWAISCATAISDAYVIKNLVKWSPNISYTYALSVYPQEKCSGGSARQLLLDIKNGHGITSSDCLDYSWCFENKRCTTLKSENHFTTTKEEQKYLSSLVPKPICTKSDVFLYTIDNVYSMTVDHINDIPNIHTIIKKHIICRGPIVAGFLIADNFVSGKFTNCESGIFFENAMYDNKKTIFPNTSFKILGSHSVVVVGWGISKNINYENNKTDVPYWICRNSWGTTWGDDGFFKIAMYPFNKVCQFTKKVTVINNNVMQIVGGATGFNVTKKPHLKNVNKDIFNLLYTEANMPIMITALALAIFMILKNF